MTLTAKVATLGRIAGGGDGPTTNLTANSGAKPQRWRGQGNEEPGYQVGAGQVKHVAVAEYDFAKDGALTFAALAGNGSGVWIPKDALVTHSFIHVHTAPVGPTNMSVSLQNDADLVAAAAISGAPWSTDGAITTGVVEPGTESGYIKLTAAREISFGATVANTSTGKFTVFVEYIMSTVA